MQGHATKMLKGFFYQPLPKEYVTEKLEKQANLTGQSSTSKTMNPKSSKLSPVLENVWHGV
jgi:hypothetical protein